VVSTQRDARNVGLRNATNAADATTASIPAFQPLRLLRAFLRALGRMQTTPYLAIILPVDDVTDTCVFSTEIIGIIICISSSSSSSSSIRISTRVVYRQCRQNRSDVAALPLSVQLLLQSDATAAAAAAAAAAAIVRVRACTTAAL